MPAVGWCWHGMGRGHRNWKGGVREDDCAPNMSHYIHVQHFPLPSFPFTVQSMNHCLSKIYNRNLPNRSNINGNVASTTWSSTTWSIHIIKKCLPTSKQFAYQQTSSCGRHCSSLSDCTRPNTLSELADTIPNLLFFVFVFIRTTLLRCMTRSTAKKLTKTQAATWGIRLFYPRHSKRTAMGNLPTGSNLERQLRNWKQVFTWLHLYTWDQ